jgi:hypothetical protein
MTSVPLGKCIDSHFWVRGLFCYVSDSMSVRVMVGGWDILSVGTKQGSEVCLSHIAEVLSSVQMTLLSPWRNICAHTWLGIRQTLWIRVSCHNLSSRSPVLLKVAFLWLTSFEKVVLILLSSKVSHSVQNHLFIIYVSTVAVCSYWWLLCCLWQSKWWQQQHPLTPQSSQTSSVHCKREVIISSRTLRLT